MVAVNWRSLRKQVLSPSFMRRHGIAASRPLIPAEKSLAMKALARREGAEAYERVSEVVVQDSRWNSHQGEALRGQAQEFFCAAELLNSPKPTVSKKRLDELDHLGNGLELLPHLYDRNKRDDAFSSEELQELFHSKISPHHFSNLQRIANLIYFYHALLSHKRLRFQAQNLRFLRGEMKEDLGQVFNSSREVLKELSGFVKQVHDPASAQGATDLESLLQAKAMSPGRLHDFVAFHSSPTELYLKNLVGDVDRYYYSRKPRLLRAFSENARGIWSRLSGRNYRYS